MPVAADPSPESNGQAPSIPIAGDRTTEAPERAAGGKLTERGGPKGPEPTRFGDWERSGRCIDF